MKNQKPKGKIPSLIGSSNGRPRRENVERKSDCKRCHCEINPGSDCFGIPKAGSGFISIRRFCKNCFEKVLEQTQKDLDEIKKLI